MTATGRIGGRAFATSQPAGACTGHACGFTLIELLVVIVMIAAITGMTIGVLGVGRSGRQLRDAEQSLAGELRYTRTQALTTGVPQRFEMDLDKRTWTAAGAHHGTLPKTVQVTFNSVREEQTDPHSAAIRFFPDGSATGGRINLRTQGAGWRVDVRWLTGEVSQTRLPDAPH